MNEVVDLDILRPEPKYVKLAGKKIDVSFIPVGITFEVDSVMRELAKIPEAKATAGGAETKKAFDLTVKLCAVFASLYHDEMTEAWFREHCDAGQIEKFASEIKEALVRSYAGVKAYGKN